MKKMVPLGMFIAVATVCQIVVVAIALVIEQFGFKWGSVLVFGFGYIAMFGVAWKLTVLIVDGVLAKKGLLNFETPAQT